jgi:putative ABC transport system ATP-binding protein
LGQIQRISIARALYRKPEILFCDEPTSALDARAAGEVMQVIERIAASYPVLLVSHSGAVRRAAQTLLVVEAAGVKVTELAGAGATS